MNKGGGWRGVEMLEAAGKNSHDREETRRPFP